MRSSLACLSSVLASGLLAVTLSAQTAPPDVRLPLVMDTGWIANSGDQQSVIAAFPVHIDGASSLRLYFDEMSLSGSPATGDGTIVRFSSLLDGAVQTLDAVTAAQWHDSSAYFNGDTVLVELIAPAGSGRNRLRLGSVDAGAPPIFPKSQCGATDDRVLSFDNRLGRLLPVGCTAWMIDDCQHCFLTAGHCVGTIDVVEFNVPLSTAGGSLVHPAPADQYVVDDNSDQTNGGQGTGNDYAYFGVFPNTQTGLTPSSAYGTWFELVPPPPVVGNTIRITGYGVDSSPSSHNQVQQTSTGPFFASFGTTLQYQTDTEGGNSGSPVIWENANKAIGIHTHGGCGSSSGNAGTSSQHPGLQSFLANPKGVCASSCDWSDLGNALAGSFGDPLAQHQGGPVPGTLVRLLASKLPLFGTTSLFVGTSAIYAPFKGGVLVPSPDIVITGLPISLGTANFGFTFPAGVPSGSVAVFQFWTADAGAVKGFSATNALQLAIP
jgi:V8-like Glu-specific endopeptidase